MTKWQLHTEGFITKSNVPASPRIPSAEVLDGCRKGLTKRMQKATSGAERKRLKDIRDEIDFLIDNL